MLILESLAEHIHVEHTEEPTSETATKRSTRFVHHLDATISQAQLGQRLLKIFVVIRIFWVDAGEDHGLGCLVSGESCNFGALPEESVTDLRIGDGLHVGEEVADLPLREQSCRHEVGLDDADLVDLVALAAVERHELLHVVVVQDPRHDFDQTGDASALRHEPCIE